MTECGGIMENMTSKMMNLMGISISLKRFPKIFSESTVANAVLNCHIDELRLYFQDSPPPHRAL